MKTEEPQKLSMVCFPMSTSFVATEQSTAMLLSSIKDTSAACASKPIWRASHHMVCKVPTQLILPNILELRPARLDK
eukprot:959785-Amphidinium_carterae.2